MKGLRVCPPARRSPINRTQLDATQQGYPLSEVADAIGRDHHNDTTRRPALERALLSAGPVCTGLVQQARARCEIATAACRASRARRQELPSCVVDHHRVAVS